ncbi:MAG: thioredoxin family protein [Chitinophagaceae bacterium]|nr:thioredoxin family protein [Chitinophagaceae bacterium]
MKKISLLFLSMTLGIVSFSQTNYQEIVEKPGEKTLKGIISREILLADTSFHWYAQNLKGYTPNALAITNLKKQADSIELLVFMGTWCEDSQFIIPKLFTLVNASGFPESKLSLFGVDRNKTTISHLAEALKVTNVPSIIVFKNGKEIGRVVEYGKYGMFDKELGEILQ